MNHLKMMSHVLHNQYGVTVIDRTLSVVGSSCSIHNITLLKDQSCGAQEPIKTAISIVMHDFHGK